LIDSFLSKFAKNKETMAKYLDPKADVTFKKIFGENKDILISFLNSVLPLPKRTEIQSLEYISSEMVPKTPDGKNSIVDVRCTDNSKRTFIVEMQMYWTNAFKKRALFNTCKAYSYPVEKGSNYCDLKPVYTLSLVNDIAFPEYPDDFYHIFTLTHNKHNNLKIDEIVLVFIELPKFKSQYITDKKMMSFWLRFLTEIDDTTQQVSPDLTNDSCISKALSLAEESAYSLAELSAIARYWDMVSVERTIISDKMEEGRKEGIEVGLKKGLKEGLKKGLQEGSTKTKIEIARAMKASGEPIEKIVLYFGLTEEQVSKL